MDEVTRPAIFFITLLQILVQRVFPLGSFPLVLISDLLRLVSVLIQVEQLWISVDRCRHHGNERALSSFLISAMQILPQFVLLQLGLDLVQSLTKSVVLVSVALDGWQSMEEVLLLVTAKRRVRHIVLLLIVHDLHNR